jgi:hypothetical protein
MQGLCNKPIFKKNYTKKKHGDGSKVQIEFIWNE